MLAISIRCCCCCCCRCSLTGLNRARSSRMRRASAKQQQTPIRPSAPPRARMSWLWQARSCHKTTTTRQLWACQRVSQPATLWSPAGPESNQGCPVRASPGFVSHHRRAALNYYIAHPPLPSAARRVPHPPGSWRARVKVVHRWRPRARAHRPGPFPQPAAD